MTYPFLGLPGSTAACVTSREATARMKSLEDCGAVSRRLREGWVCNCRDEDWLPSAISCSSLSCRKQLRYHRSVLTSQQHLEDCVHERLSATWLAMTQGDVPWYLLPTAISCSSLSCTRQLRYHCNVLTSQQHLEDFVHGRLTATWLAMPQGDVPWYLLM